MELLLVGCLFVSDCFVAVLALVHLDVLGWSGGGEGDGERRRCCFAGGLHGGLLELFPGCLRDEVSVDGGAGGEALDCGRSASGGVGLREMTEVGACNIKNKQKKLVKLYRAIVEAKQLSNLVTVLL